MRFGQSYQHASGLCSNRNGKIEGEANVFIAESIN